MIETGRSSRQWVTGDRRVRVLEGELLEVVITSSRITVSEAIRVSLYVPRRILKSSV
jgi:hypothetical protein